MKLKHFELSLLVFFALMALSHVVGLPNLDLSGFSGSTAGAMKNVLFYSVFFVVGYGLVRFFKEG